MPRNELSPYSKGQMEFHVGLKAEDDYTHHGVINGFKEGIAIKSGKNHPVIKALEDYDHEHVAKTAQWASRTQDVLEPLAHADMEADLNSRRKAA